MRIYDELKEWRDELAYFDVKAKKHPTPKGVKRYIYSLLKIYYTKSVKIIKLEEENNKLKVRVKSNIKK